MKPDCLERFVPKVILDWTPSIVIAAGGVYVVTTVGSKFIANLNKQRMLNRWKDTPKDIVILHQLPRGITAPNLSPFALKLETYLRMANIPYQIDDKDPFGPKGKTPWITLNGEHMGDSQLISEFLAKKFQKSIGNYTSEQRALGHLVRVVADEHLFWALTTWRWMYSDPEHLKKIFAMSLCALKAFRKMANKRVTIASFYLGTGRHSQEDVINIMTQDLRALSAFLGNKKFLLGDEPSEADCTVFAHVAQFLWCMPSSPYEKIVNDEMFNLKEYCIRMKEHFWPDWDKCLAGAKIEMQ